MTGFLLRYFQSILAQCLTHPLYLTVFAERVMRVVQKSILKAQNSSAEFLFFLYVNMFIINMNLTNVSSPSHSPIPIGISTPVKL